MYHVCVPYICFAFLPCLPSINLSILPCLCPSIRLSVPPSVRLSVRPSILHVCFPPFLLSSPSRSLYPSSLPVCITVPYCMIKHFVIDRLNFLSQGALATLGIPFVDVLRILVAILLLGNVEFVDGEGLELDVKGNNGRCHLTHWRIIQLPNERSKCDCQMNWYLVILSCDG